MLKKYVGSLMFLVYFLSLFFFLGCGDTEDTDSIVIPDELYDTSELTYDISDAEIQELMALDVPTNWDQTKDPELRAKYYHADLLQQFGNIPAELVLPETGSKDPELHAKYFHAQLLQQFGNIPAFISLRNISENNYWHKADSSQPLVNRLIMPKHNLFSGRTSPPESPLKGF